MGSKTISCGVTSTERWFVRSFNRNAVLEQIRSLLGVSLQWPCIRGVITSRTKIWDYFQHLVWFDTLVIYALSQISSIHHIYWRLSTSTYITRRFVNLMDSCYISLLRKESKILIIFTSCVWAIKSKFQCSDQLSFICQLHRKFVYPHRTF